MPLSVQLEFADRGGQRPAPDRGAVLLLIFLAVEDGAGDGFDEDVPGGLAVAVHRDRVGRFDALAGDAPAGRLGQQRAKGGLALRVGSSDRSVSGTSLTNSYTLTPLRVVSPTKLAGLSVRVLVSKYR